MIKDGDRVKVWWDDGELEGEVTNMPRGNGDLLQIKDDKGNEYAINPYYYKFDNMVKTPIPDEGTPQPFR